VRAHPIFEAAPDIQALAAILGAATLLVAGLIALVQWDIKKVIAYSTMSQIGYMFLGAGVGAYGFAIFHLLTHAFFKALLFLAAGVVIHYLAGEQDIRRMGGLRDVLPRTRIAFLVGTLALVGIPPLAGFWSKDAILGSALATGGGLGWTMFAAGVLGVLLTGAYSFRLYFTVFHGRRAEAPAPAHAEAHGHGHGEGPLSMLVPVGVLTVLSAIGGLLSIPGVWHPLSDWLAESAEPLVEPTTGEEYLTSAIALVLAAGPERTGGEVFNVGHSDENYRKLDLVEIITGELGRGDVRFVERNEDPRDYKVAFEKVRDGLGFEPLMRVPDGVSELTRALEADAFGDPWAARYRNIP
jgi:NADH-quinone oxidoreductase subunit L